jgi:hypothetical protein
MSQIERELWAARQALDRLQRKLATLPGWRDSLAWETVERISWELDRGLFDAYSCSRMPQPFVHWRDKYCKDEDFPV